MAYEQIPTVKLARPDTPEGFMIVNASEYRADLPQWMYDQGLAWNPAVYAPYVEPVVKAPAPEAESTARTAAGARSTAPEHGTAPAAEKK